MANPASGAAKDIITAVLGGSIRKTPDAAADTDAMDAGGLQPALKRPRVLSHDRDIAGENGTHHQNHQQNHQENPSRHHQPPRSQLEEVSGGQYANGIHDQDNQRGGGGSSGIPHQREQRQRGESISLEKMSLDDARLAVNGPVAVLNGAAEAGATTGGAVAGVAYSSCGDFRVPSVPATRPFASQNGGADYRHPYQHQPYHDNRIQEQQQQQNGYGGGYRSAPVQQALVNGHAHSNGFQSQHANGDAHSFGDGGRMRHNDGGAGELNGIIVQDLRPNGGGGGRRLDSTSSSSADAALLPLPSIIDYPGSGSGARLGIHQGGSGGSGEGGTGGGAQFTRTKVVCTLGPASREVGVLERMLRAGMNVARFNFSHGSHEYHQETLDNLKTAMERTKTLCAVLLDTKGPEIRTGLLEGGKAVQLVRGSEVVVSTAGYGTVRGNASHISMSYANLARDVRPGCTILCADGSITLTVLACDVQAGTVRCRCENTAMLGERKNVNLPGVVVDLPTVTDKDRHDILHWAVPNAVDFIAASFVRKGSDVAAIRSLLGRKHGQRIHIISKVENQEGLVNFDDILRESDGIMVARGDLGMEIPTEKIFLAQKMMIYKCNAAGKPVVTATQMLESMVKSPRPTRAEATDVANAVLDGTDAVMLSGETAAGAYAVDAVGVMARICREAEACLDYAATFKAIVAATPHPLSLLESLASSGVQMAVQIGAAAIVVLTRGGFTARLVAKYRPPMPVLAVAVPSLHTERDDSSLRPLSVRCTGLTPARQALLVRGLVPLLGEGLATVAEEEDEAVAESATQEMVVHALAHAVERGLCRPGDCVVMLHRIGAAWVMEIVTVPVQDHDY